MQHLEDHWNRTQLHKFTDVPTVPVAHLHKHMIDNIGPILPFNLDDESIDDTSSIWILFSHAWIYVTVTWPFWSGSLQHNIVDDDMEVAPIYRINGKAGQLVVRLHENHDLWMKWEPTWMESQQKQQALL